MIYKEWVLLNIEYEKKLLKEIEEAHGRSSKEYKKKFAQLTDLIENK